MALLSALALLLLLLQLAAVGAAAAALNCTCPPNATTGAPVARKACGDNGHGTHNTFCPCVRPIEPAPAAPPSRLAASLPPTLLLPLTSLD